MTEQVFVAREREVVQLQTSLDRALASQGTVCFVTGEAGAGKTALVTEFTRRALAQHDDLLVAVGDCNAQTGIGDPYLPFREVLGLLTGDVETKLAQGAITPENAGRLQDFLRVSGQALVDLGPDLIDIFVPGVGLATRAGTFLAGKVGWLSRLEALTEQRVALAGGSSLDQDRIFQLFLAHGGDHSEAEACFRRSIDVARRQQAETFGVAGRAEPEPAVAVSRQARRSSRDAGRRLRLVH